MLTTSNAILIKIFSFSTLFFSNHLFYESLTFFIYRHLAPVLYYFFLYTVFVCKFRPQESQSDVMGDLSRMMISLVVGSYFGMPPLLLPGLEPASSPGMPTVLTRVRCLSLKPDMDREVCSHPDPE